LSPENDTVPQQSPHERVIVDCCCGTPGPCLVVLAGLHGDEFAGVTALERIRDAIGVRDVPIRGRLLGVVGNTAALARRERYVDRDLNRDWWEQNVEALRAREPSSDSVEDGEMRALLDVIEALEDEPSRPVVFLDLHSTSADGLPFSCIPDTIANLKIAMRLPVPTVLNLEETVDGSLMGYLSDDGYGGVIFEGGRHADPGTADILESAVWILLVALGCVDSRDVPEFEAYRDRLASQGTGLPKVMEVKDVHRTRDGDGFRMQPGFVHFTPVDEGQLLATDHSGEIRSSRKGRVLMPRYQLLSDQGFFITQDIRVSYVRLLFLIRWLRLDRIVHLLPGAKRDPESPNYLKIARWVPDRLVDIVRLLGWRRVYRGAGHTLLRRRRIRKV
jgi:predicted deacylase